MNKATQQLVRAYFTKTNQLNIDGLLEVIEKTENVDLAIDLLLGTYQQPVLPPTSMVQAGYDSNAPLVEGDFKSYDKWKDRVEYTYLAVNSRYRYVDMSQQEADEKITYENIYSFGSSYMGKLRVMRTDPSGVLATHKGTTSSELWLKGAKQDTDGNK